MKVAVGTNFTSKVRVTITQEGKDVTTSGNLRMRYGDVIQLTLVDPLLGIAEIGRLELSPDKVLIIDRVNKRYVDTNYEEFSALKSRNIDFNTIQEFFWQEAKKGDKRDRFETHSYFLIKREARILRRAFPKQCKLTLV